MRIFWPFISIHPCRPLWSCPNGLTPILVLPPNRANKDDSTAELIPSNPRSNPHKANSTLLRDRGDDARADGAATLANSEAQLLSIAIGTINSTSMVTLSPGITISVPSGKVHTPVTSWCEIELRPVVGEERGMPATLVLGQNIGFSLNFVCGFTEPGLHKTWPRSTSSRLVPRKSAPMLSPA